MSKVISYTSKSQSITADWYEPAATLYPVVVVSYGTEGMNTPFDKMINEYCLELSKADIAVIRPDYFKSTNTLAGMQGVFMSGPSHRFDTWVEAIVDAANYALNLSSVNGKLAFVGFSLGANLSLRAAADFIPNPKAVVDFFGPIGAINQSLFSSALAAKLPPVQIHHGNLDGIVPFSESLMLESWLNLAGVTCEFDKSAYSGSGHPGQQRAREMLPTLPNADWSDSDQKNSLAASIAFLKKSL
jgi:dienelactone hydrolase